MQIVSTVQEILDIGQEIFEKQFLFSKKYTRKEIIDHCLIILKNCAYANEEIIWNGQDFLIRKKV